MKAIIVIWGIFGLFVGITCHVGGTQIEEGILALFLGILVAAATAILADASGVQRVEREKRRSETSRFDLLTEDDLNILRIRLAEGEAAESISTFSPPSDR